MTLQEAITIKTTYLKGDEAVLHDDHIEADKLLIEAGKRVQKDRTFPYTLPLPLLPGETKD